MDLSIVTTLYCSAPYIEEFHTRVCAVAEKITSDYEIIFVNDGSPENSLDIAVSLYERDERVKVIDLSRNFGHHKAIMTGLAHARGKLVFLLDVDLEEEPELLEQFYQEFRRSGADVVYGVQQTRKGGFFERVSGNLFYTLFNRVSSYPVPPNCLAARLMSQRYVAALVEHKDREIFLAGLWAITGFKQIPLTVVKHHKGSSTYNLRRKVSTFVNSITSFSVKPLVFVFYMGCAISFVSSLAALYLIIQRIFFGVYLAGWPSLIVSVWLLGGLTIFCLGVIGIYLSKVFMEIKPRPYTVIRRIYDRASEANHDFQNDLEKCGTVL
jgi:putative glycosyltransferase